MITQSVGDKAPPAQQGFTLIEIMLALAILAVILSVLYSSYATSVEVIQKAQERTEKYQEVRVIFDLLSQQLSSTYLSAKDERSVFIGEDDTSGDFPVDSLTFTAPITMLLPLDRPQGGLCKIRYFLQSQIEGSIEKSLLQQEICPLVAEGESVDGGITLELSSDVVGLDLKYYRQEGEEFDAWDSRASEEASLPLRVKATIIFSGEAQKKTRERVLQPFSTFIDIPVAGS